MFRTVFCDTYLSWVVGVIFKVMISIIHPTRRKEQALATRAKWLSNADMPENIEYLFSTDDGDISTEGLRGIRGLNKTAVEAINLGATHCTGELIIVVSDDFNCESSWDTMLLMQVDGEKDFLVKTRDGIQPVLITLPIMDRTYYERFGYIYHPEFRHMGCDVELTAVGLMLGKVIFSDLLFPHLHYSTGLTPKDEINEKNDKTYAHGDMILAKHRENNFGIENPVCTYESIIWHPQG